MRMNDRAYRNLHSLHNFGHSTAGCNISKVGTNSMADLAAADREGSDSNSVILGGGAVAVSHTSMNVAATASTSSNEQINHSSSLHYKGVMRQHDGHWGAQIYADGRGTWLGTFSTEQAAAGAFDRAAMKLHRQAQSPRNFPAASPSPSINAREHEFQAMHGTEEVVDMIRTGTHRSRLAQFGTNDGTAVATPRRPSCRIAAGSHAAWHEMFVKELTPSDVGKLNRLVIPKKYATQYFPQTLPEEVTVEFVDREGQAWRFRYCYWKSSQSYVFTKGWNKFVKAKRLQAKDAVRFYRCDEISVQRRSYFLIDVIRRDSIGSSVLHPSTSNSAAGGLELSIKMNRYDDHGNYCDGCFENDDGVHMHPDFKQKRMAKEETGRPGETKRFKLFGEWIN